MKPVLLIDFGSTYTKLTAVDVEAETLLGTAASYTTIETDIGDGLRNGLKLLGEKTGKLDFVETYACSSAAGGLRMVSSGLVPELTSEAAKLASLGAGAKVVGLYSFQMTEEDMEEIQELKPDIFLLVGGTDGGNTACIEHNAQMLASISPKFPIVIAGNRNSARTYVCTYYTTHQFASQFANTVLPEKGAILYIFIKQSVRKSRKAEKQGLIKINAA